MNFHSVEIMDALRKMFLGKSHGQPLNKDLGFRAAQAVVNLMQQTFKALQPAQIVKDYVPIKKLKPKDVADHLWSQFGTDTIDVMADGTRTLSMLCDSAWKEGGGTASMAGQGKIKPADLKKLYIQPKFLESFTLAQIQPVLTGISASGGVAAKKRSTKKH